RQEAKPLEGVNVLFSLRDVDRCLRRRCHQPGQAIQHPTHSVEFPGPASLAIGSPLGELLVGSATNLEQQLALLVLVSIGRDDFWPVALAFGREEVAPFQSERTDDVPRFATLVAVEQDAPVISDAYGQTRAVVVVRWTAGCPSLARSNHSLQASEDGF